MAEPENEPNQRGHVGEPRASDRRGSDRRNLERRTPPPPWRRPWALVAYGVVGAFAIFMIGGALFGDDEEELSPEQIVAAPRANPQSGAAPLPQVEPPVDAFAAADYERLVISGEAARGRRVRTQLYCDAPKPVALRQSATPLESSLAEIAEEGRVVAANCKWGEREDERRQDLLLVIPPQLADDFAAAPVATDDFVRRRRVLAEVEWVGRSDALSLRTGGVLRAVFPS